MPKITFLPNAELCPEGKTVEAEEGESIVIVLFEKDLTRLKKVMNKKMIC